MHLRPIGPGLDRDREQRRGREHRDPPVRSPLRPRARRPRACGADAAAAPHIASADDAPHRLHQRRDGRDRVSGFGVVRRAVVVVHQAAGLAHEQQSRGHVPRQVRQHHRRVQPPRRKPREVERGGPVHAHAQALARQACEHRQMHAVLLLRAHADLEVRTRPTIASRKSPRPPRSRSARPLRYAPPPCRAMKRSPNSGASTIPSTGCPPTTSDSEIAHSGLSLAKLIVPSIGSSTQRGRFGVILPPPPSSPRNGMSGVAVGKRRLDRRLDLQIDVGGEVSVSLGDQRTDVRPALPQDPRADVDRLLGGKQQSGVVSPRSARHVITVRTPCSGVIRSVRPPPVEFYGLEATTLLCRSRRAMRQDNADILRRPADGTWRFVLASRHPPATED